MREVKRKAKVGEYIKLTEKKFSFDEVGDILKVDFVDGDSVQVLGKYHKRDTRHNDIRWNYYKYEYVVLEDYKEENMRKFIVGDKIKGNKKADRYCITDSDFVGYVIENLSNGKIKVSNFKNSKDNEYTVDEDCFDLVGGNLKGILKNGDILETNDKEHYIYFNTDDHRNLISHDGGHMCLKDYDDKLIIHKDINNEFTIKKVYRFDYLGYIINFINNKRELTDAKLIWEREEEIKEMTVEEISKALGYEVKVVK